MPINCERSKNFVLITEYCLNIVMKYDSCSLPLFRHFYVHSHALKIVCPRFYLYRCPLYIQRRHISSPRRHRVLSVDVVQRRWQRPPPLRCHHCRSSVRRRRERCPQVHHSQLVLPLGETYAALMKYVYTQLWAWFEIVLKHVNTVCRHAQLLWNTFIRSCGLSLRSFWSILILFVDVCLAQKCIYELVLASFDRRPDRRSLHLLGCSEQCYVSILLSNSHLLNLSDHKKMSSEDLRGE